MKDDKRTSGHAPHRGMPLRQWTAPSYDPNTGRAAGSSTELQKSYSFDGEPAHPIRQLADTATKHTVRHGKTSR
jgi:hypothetical protein